MNILEEIQNCPVEWKELGEVAEVGTGNNNTNEQVENGKYPFYVRSKNIKTINTYLFDEEAIVIPGEGDIGKIFHYVKGKYGLHQRAYRIHITVDNIKTKFIYYYMHANFKSFITKKAVSATVSSIRKPMIEKFPIPIPPREIQEKIVQKLDKMTEYVTELTSELTSRKKQYSFYRDKLLSFDDEVYQVEWKTLLEVSKKITSGGTPDRSNSLYYGGSIPWLRTQEVDFREIYDTELGITEEGLANSSAKWIEKNAVIVAMYGATAAKVGIAKIPLTTNQACCNIEIDEDIANYRYVYYWLTYNYETLKSMGQGSQSNINAGMIKTFKIPVPSLEIQSRIVQVLDNFDKVCNDLNIGLPKEIELRQKQYEYFREKLLTFVAEGEYTESRVE